ncbi:MAG: 4Fe-4S dicluster domain-containing protein [Acidobacteriota bacterium]
MNGEKIWKIFQRQDGDPCETPRAAVSRRAFIELIGFSAAGLLLASCRPPQQKIIPFVKQPVEMTPGIANWYASTCGGCNAACGTLVKVRDGRPVKMEGNPEHPLSGGGLCAVAHAMIFNLYDSERLRQPLIGSKPASWSEVDSQIPGKLAAVKQAGGKVRLLSSKIVSPTSQDVIARFLSQFADGKHIVYEAVSSDAIRQSHLRTHKTAAIPALDFEKAKLIVSFGADFLGAWGHSVQAAKEYARARNLRDGRREMLRHVQFESRMSLTGSNADARYTVSPREENDALLLLARLVAEKKAVAAPQSIQSFDPSRLSARVRDALSDIAAEIVKHSGKSLILSGSSDADAQSIVNFINHLAGNYGNTLSITSSPEVSVQGGDVDMVRLVEEMKQGQIAALLIFSANPAYNYFNRDEFTAALSRVPLKISFNSHADETTSLTDFTCPHPHFLEAWDDAQPAPRVFSLNQPAISPLLDTRPYQESLLRWSGDARAYYEVLRDNWKTKLFPLQKKWATFDEFWDRSLHDGVFVSDGEATVEPAFTIDEVGRAAEALKQRSAEGLSLILYEKISLRDGRHASNPWLQELPDPITKVTWDNYATVSPKLARELQLKEGRVVRISNQAASIELPVFIQTGQDDSTIAVALGYGRTKAGRGGSGIGVNAYPFVRFENGTFQYVAGGARIEKTDSKIELAMTQRHDTMDGRPIVREVAFADYLEGRIGENSNHASQPKSIWKDHPYGDHKWAMVVDLNACIGCSACLLSCQAENNVPVVGREEVLRQREMHWIRLDRYYKGEDENPTVVYQPVMCFQCDNASCESVCPVLATVHSSEGLNMQVYNRCVGTRYCANNCAYKVRRFNWFDYPHTDAMANLALNPDVTVRTRGVMEKCTFCVQRIEEVKILARNEGREIRDREIRTACQQSCPTQAIFFGDLTDAESRVNHLKHDERDYILLEELNLRPQVSYLAKVRNSPNEEA